MRSASCPAPARPGSPRAWAADRPAARARRAGHGLRVRPRAASLAVERAGHRSGCPWLAERYARHWCAAAPGLAGLASGSGLRGYPDVAREWVTSATPRPHAVRSPAGRYAFLLAV